MSANQDRNTEIFATAVVFLLPALALTTKFGLSLIQLIILLSCAWFANKGISRFYAENYRAFGWMIASVGGYFLTTLLRLPFSGRGWALLDGPLRLLLGLSCIGFVAWLRPAARWFWLGMCAGAIGAAVFALVQWLFFGIGRAEGFTGHSITFGDLSMAMGLMALCSISEFHKTRLAPLPLAALLCGVLASILSGSRGGWIALPLAAIPVMLNRRGQHSRLIVLGLGLAIALFALASLVPASGVTHRAHLAILEVQQYLNDGNISTSVGTRFELWRASWLMFIEHPWIGVGRDAFPAAMQELVQLGQMPVSHALQYNNSHNDLFNSLATGGLLDFGLLLSLYLAPLAIFIGTLRRSDCNSRPAALAGVVLVLCFMLFGLTEVVMFGRMILKAFYTMMICVLIGFCLPDPRKTMAPERPYK